MLFTMNLIAMGAPAGGSSQQSPFNFFIMMILFFGIMYVMMIRPQQRKEKERQSMLSELKKGDRILFAGGLIGVVAHLGEKTLRVKIAEKMQIEVARASVTAVIPEDADISADMQQP